MDDNNDCYSSISMNGTPLGRDAICVAMRFDSSISMNGTPLGQRDLSNYQTIHSSISMNGTPLGRNTRCDF